MLLAIIISANYLFFLTFARFSGLVSPLGRRLFFTGILSLSLSFIIASLLAHYYHNFLVVWLYTLSSFWIGWLLYLLAGSALLWPARFLADKSGWDFNQPIVLAVMIILALTTAAYGVVQARQIQAKKMDVVIAGLPANWQGKTIAQISDLHVGITRGAEFISRIVDRLNALKPDLVVITGDFFDGSCPVGFNDFAAPLKRLAAPYGVYFVTGNHETYTNLDNALAALDAAGVRVLRDEVVKLDGLTIIGADYPARSINKDLAPLFKRLQPAEPNILLYHEPRYINEAKQAGIKLQLSGHTHAGQLWPIRYIDYLIYGRYYYGLHRAGDFSIYTTSGTGFWGPPLRVGTDSEIAVFRLQ
jgi:hypothetical protein